MRQVQSFAVVEASRATEGATSGTKTPRRFLDFVVDGDPLYPLVTPYDTVTALWLDAGPSAAVEARGAVDRLLGNHPGDAPNGRVSVYVCSECGDLGCGALTVELQVDDDRVTWRSWGYQSNDEDDVKPVAETGLEDLSFDRREYEQVLQGALDRLR